MHDAHQKTAEHQELAAHRSAAEHNEKGDNKAGNWHADRALDYSYQAYRLAKKPTPSQGR